MEPLYPPPVAGIADMDATERRRRSFDNVARRYGTAERSGLYPDAMGVRVGLLAVGLIAVGCTTGDGGRVGDAMPSTAAVDRAAYQYGDPPAVGGEPTPTVADLFAGIVEALSVGGFATAGLDELVAAGDARHAWLISDLMRFSGDPPSSRNWSPRSSS